MTVLLSAPSEGTPAGNAIGKVLVGILIICALVGLYKAVTRKR